MGDFIIRLDALASFPEQLPVGSAVAFIETAQYATYDELLHFSQHSRLNVTLPLSDFKKHKAVLTGNWHSPVGGLFFLAGSPFLGSTSLPAQSDVASLIGLVDAVGLDINDTNTVRQLILSMKTPTAVARLESDMLQIFIQNTFG